MGPHLGGALNALGDTVSLQVRGQGAIGIQLVVTADWIGIADFQVSLDGVNYAPVNVLTPNGTIPVTSAAAAGIWLGSVAGMAAARVRCSAWTSGSAAVLLQAAEAAPAGGGGGSGSAPAGTIGLAVPATASPMAIKDAAGNLAYPSLDGSGNLNIAG